MTNASGKFASVDKSFAIGTFVVDRTVAFIRVDSIVTSAVVEARIAVAFVDLDFAVGGSVR